MGKLRVLPSGIANMIAAGEVVARPASVVKELMENSVDALAGSVNVVVNDAGRTLIQVIDDGSGMSRSDAVLCFERHATSKIATAQDLNEILTYGFRGEALAAISSVAEVTLKTRRKQDQVGVKVSVGGTSGVKVSECSCPVGANFEIRNLFYNTPARRKFLKSDNVEFKHIVEEFSRVALTRCDISFSLTHNGRVIFALKPAKSLKFRISDLMGASLASELADVGVQTSLMEVSGYIGKPEAARKAPGNQFFFVNGRYFRSPYLHKAVMKAYEALVPEGMNPSYFLFLKVDPQTVDVNIHPTKAEIKFEDEPLIFQTLFACVKESLGRNSFGATIDFDASGAAALPQLGESFREYKGAASFQAPEIQSSYNPFEEMEPSRDFDTLSYRPGASVDKRQDYGVLFEKNDFASRKVMLLGQGKYILTPSMSGLMVVSVRRARERVLYERTLKALAKNAHVSQTALFPVEVKVGVAQALLFKEHQSMLASLGFDLAVGDDKVVVNGVPDGYSCESGKVVRLVGDLQLILSEETEGMDDLLQSRTAQKFALLGVSSADELDSPVQAQSLLDELFACENSSLTPDGRKIAAIISFDEIGKMF